MRACSGHHRCWVALTLLAHIVAPSTIRAAQQAGDQASSPEQTSILVTDLRAVGVDGALAAQATAMTAEALARPGFTVTAESELEAIATTEADRDALSCASDSRCLAAIQARYDADLLVSGALGKIGSRLTMTLALHEGRGVDVTRRVTATLAGPAELQATIRGLVDELLGTSDVLAPRFQLPGGRSRSPCFPSRRPASTPTRLGTSPRSWRWPSSRSTVPAWWGSTMSRT